ncbi:serine-type D-Ala-D-Ala carboxypeptidase [Indibacter alkaliphilus LW1]|uniref:Serine-type D-Ala-D-Ala carboxypeptidase n=1 Tax=Indibacter alkaliphilus (strain CCUG 57479 / KCTC 22604 / LW1) TaxID=1189612 RepID=S2DRW2_INDAL|nr:serine hydrolase domain-containing protein [Indibacter alkaliphilus]EOZ92588.1 serine-type D-Ala-D-Ala carboxypeptidase [Indibacter alkaliphilus LW1]
MYIKKILFALLLLIPAQLFSQGMQTCNCPDTKLQFSTNKVTVLKAALDKLTGQGIPGAVVGVFDESGYWEISSGFAKIENQTKMQLCHLQYLQSISKTYLAVTILQLYEEGKLGLDNKITEYLSSQLSSNIPNASEISVRMLLNHTSGIPEYNSQPTYVTHLLQNPTRIFQPEEYFLYIKNKKPDFEPGTKYGYRNTNYVILALIAEQITGDHKQFMEERIFKVLNLKNTIYRIEQGETYEKRLVNTYWDRFSDGTLENVSVLQNSNVASMIGDDGIITTPEDAITFLKGLMGGKLISNNSLELMQEWVKNLNGKEVYGLGLNISDFKGHKGIGHSGGGLGAGVQLYYFPQKKIYTFLAINLGTVTNSPIHQNAELTLEKIYNIILQ